MKRVFVLCLCFALFACAPVARREDVTSQTAAGPSEPVTAEASAAPEVERFPVTEAIVTLPQTVEPVNLEDHLLIYVSDGATYLYAYGESILLHQGGMLLKDPDECPGILSVSLKVRGDQDQTRTFSQRRHDRLSGGDPELLRGNGLRRDHPVPRLYVPSHSRRHRPEVQGGGILLQPFYGGPGEKS